MSDAPETLWQVLDRFRPSEILGWDLMVGLASAGGAIWATFTGRGGRLVAVAPVAVGLAGVTVTTVIASLALMAAFMSPEFLRKIAAIGQEPTRYIAPFLATVLLGIAAALFGLVLAALSPTAPAGWLGIFGALAAFFSVWAMASLVRGLNTLVQFVRLQADAAAVPDSRDEL